MNIFLSWFNFDSDDSIRIPTKTKKEVNLNEDTVKGSHTERKVIIMKGGASFESERATNARKFNLR